MSFEIAALAALLLALIPALLVAVNLFAFSPVSPRATGRRPPASLLIPARDEEENIAACLQAAAGNRYPDLEILVMDDHSEDGTARVVTDMARQDPRISLHRAPELPPGWNGKQHACSELARAARGEVLIFLDADVRLAPNAVERIAEELERSGADLVSGFPRQITGSLLERLLIPLIHFVLLGFLPLPAMRRSSWPAFAAGCGQLIAVRQSSYRAAGGHGAIRSSRHDGVALPRAMRRAGGRTDLFDATRLAECRMYGSARQVWDGLAKNATEGMGSPGGIVPWTVLLIGGQVVPVLMLLGGLLSGASAGIIAPAATAVACGLATRALLALRFRQSWLGVLLHPLGVAILIAIQWYAFARRILGAPIAWKGRLGLDRADERVPTPRRQA